MDGWIDGRRMDGWFTHINEDKGQGCKTNIIQKYCTMVGNKRLYFRKAAEVV